MEQIRKQFPLLNHSIYANTAATGLLYDDLLEWRQEHDLDYLIGGSNMKGQSNKMHSKTRKVVGTFFNCEPDNVALVPNFTIGLNFLVEGLSKTEKVLLLESDYPSLNWPFESRGFMIDFVSGTDNLEERIYNTLKEKNITVLALSIVQWLDGIMMDMSFLKCLKDDFKDLMIISDGTQFLGTRDFNFSESSIDIIGASAYKWLLSGYGNGFLLIKDEIKHRFSLVAKGYGSGRNSKEFHHKRTFCKHLEPGHLDSLNFGSLQFSLDFLKRIGTNKIHEQNEQLSKKAKVAFTDLGLLDDVVVNRKVHSTIFNIKASKQVFDKLLQNDVVCVQRGEGIRLSFHFYNTLEEIDKIIRILKK
ncbi:aminotransferase class V-fold PLP-dependent enzyme [Croceitalea sp. MTPC9]|uniref:aminotransferase class V-fold PLP-dependent enzyme n=1 Tax=unclassified Croceitalea TaxID=2632280 RepID=UPI002B3E8451|nr:aminotransferase class V-fold PLP-dependent enzyme [Croceitalea sp. MTPC6]GMN17392.1 aminotransferase class V-fold PLP-dependent enzyme [Croceitalea sp. MTPC9]